jgi:Mrp family chromosome partitioning ATPase
VGRFFNLGPINALKTALLGEQPVANLTVPSRLAGVDVLSAGLRGNATGRVLNNRSAARVIRQACEQYDHVLIDSPPALGAADAMVWASVADGVVLSSLAGRSDMTTMRFAYQRLVSLGAAVMGAVVGNVSIRENRYSYSFSRPAPAATEGSGDTDAYDAHLPVVPTATERHDEQGN